MQYYKGLFICSLTVRCRSPRQSFTFFFFFSWWLDQFSESRLSNRKSKSKQKPRVKSLIWKWPVALYWIGMLDPRKTTCVVPRSLDRMYITESWVITGLALTSCGFVVSHPAFSAFSTVREQNPVSYFISIQKATGHFFRKEEEESQLLVSVPCIIFLPVW